MGVKIYYYLVFAILLLGVLLPQHGRNKKQYIILMATIQAFISGFRYMYLTGDLRKYAWGYYHIAEKGWMDPEVFNGGRNFLFFWLQKLVAMISNNNFQVFLIVIAITIEVALAIVIYRYSPNPCLSYLLWNCFGFYLFGFSAIKQALAMALVMLAFTGIMEDRPKKFLFWVLLAGGIHAPALIFLPAYWLSKSHMSMGKLTLYIVLAAVVYAARGPIVEFISEFYYEDTEFVMNDTLGGRFLMIIALIVVGIMLRGFNGRNFNVLLNLTIVAGLLQMFSSFDNIFTRLTDYYFQFLVLYLPMMFYPERDSIRRSRYTIRHLVLRRDERTLALGAVMMLCLWYYQYTCLGVTISYETDNYLNYRFSWQEKSKTPEYILPDNMEIDYES